jgi:hypothetical protein
MNCLYINLFFNIVAVIVQIFVKSWNQLPYPRVIEVCRLPFELRHDFFLHLIIVVVLPSENSRHHFVTFCRFITLSQTAAIFFCEFPLDVHFCVEKSYDGKHLAIGGTLDRRCHFKHVPLKQSRFYHCQTSTVHK